MKKATPPTYHIENCNVTNTTAPNNEHTASAILALAKAVEANAVAIAEAAKALRGGNTIIESAIKVVG